MDDPGIDPGEHDRALRGLSRLNRVSMADRPLWQRLGRLASGRSVLRVLDVATGGGDVPARLHGRAVAADVPVHWWLSDISPHALRVAMERLQRAGARADGFVHDIVGAAPPGSYDVALCSLFLHHLNRADAVAALRHMAEAAPHVIISDLRRTRAGMVLAAGASRVLSRSLVVHTDAVLSARAAWTAREAADMASEAGVRDARVTPVWPSRFVLEWGPA